MRESNVPDNPTPPADGNNHAHSNLPPHLQAPGGQRFPRRLRLSGSKQFTVVYDNKQHKANGPIVVHGRPNGLAFSRFGMAVPRRVGNAVARSRVKRRLREAFRLHWREWPVGYDWVINVRPHDLKHLDEYVALIAKATQAIDKRIHKQAKQQAAKQQANKAPTPDASQLKADEQAR